jgi:hypothetical protein
MFVAIIPAMSNLSEIIQSRSAIYHHLPRDYPKYCPAPTKVDGEGDIVLPRSVLYEYLPSDHPKATRRPEGETPGQGTSEHIPSSAPIPRPSTPHPLETAAPQQPEIAIPTPVPARTAGQPGSFRFNPEAPHFIRGAKLHLTFAEVEAFNNASAPADQDEEDDAK